MRRHTRACLVSVLALLASAATTAAHAIDGIFHLGFEFGGDTVAKVFYTDGSSDSAKANEGLDLALGIALGSTTKGGVQAQLLGGYVWSRTGASNGGLEWHATHVDALAFYNLTDAFRIGLGGTWQSAETKGKGVVSGMDFEYDDTLGYRLVLEWGLDAMLVGVRYTDIDYPVARIGGVDVSDAGVSVDGSSLGLYIGMRW